MYRRPPQHTSIACDDHAILRVDAVPVAPSVRPINVPCEALTPTCDIDPLMVEVEAFPELIISRLSLSAVELNGILSPNKHGNKAHRRTKHPTPSHVAVTLCNANHRAHAQLWEATHRLARFQQQHQLPTPLPELLGLQLVAMPSGALFVSHLDTSCLAWPWASSLVSLGDILISINHKPLDSYTPRQVYRYLYQSLMSANRTTTTLMFAKVQQTHMEAVATTIEKSEPTAKVGFRFRGLAAEPSLRISDISSDSILVPSCLTQSGDEILSINGHCLQELVLRHNDPASEHRSAAQSAVAEIAETLRYGTLVTAKASSTAVPLLTDEWPLFLSGLFR